MLNVSKQEVLERMISDNPWWEAGGGVSPFYTDLGKRDYFEGFYSLLAQSKARRAVVLMGPRRVGKTVMLFQSVHELLRAGAEPTHVLYLSVDQPIYQGIALDRLLGQFMAHNKLSREDKMFVLFDEIQYLPDWERHLKGVVDTYLNARIAVSGSAAAALKLKSNESGAGRFTDYLLPPLTFAEYLRLIGREDELIGEEQVAPEFYTSINLIELNHEFINYLNYGGYPEAVADPEVRKDPNRFIKRDIVDKVLLRDLPSLYGIQDIQELNRLFNTLAYNTGNILSPENLSQSSGVNKDTIRKYIEYLEAAFLIRKVRRIDQTGHRFKRERNFKVYLTNPSMRAALFNSVNTDDEAMGALAETAVFSQWFHSGDTEIAYAHWKGGEVDLVHLDSVDRPAWCTEVKWTDRYFERPEELSGLVKFIKRTGMTDVSIESVSVVTTLTKTAVKIIEGIKVEFVPTSIYCYTVGKNILLNRTSDIEYGIE